MNEDYYDSHCLITFMGWCWYIIGAHPGRLRVVRLQGTELIGAIIDISNVDWDGYCKQAVEILEREYGHVSKGNHQMDQ